MYSYLHEAKDNREWGWDQMEEYVMDETVLLVREVGMRYEV